MKALLTATATLILAATPINSLLAAQHGMGQGAAAEQAEEMKGQNAQGMTPEEAKKDTERQMERKREYDREREREHMMNGQGNRSMEREQKEIGAGTEEGEKKKERKWWRFWE